MEISLLLSFQGRNQSVNQIHVIPDLITKLSGYLLRQKMKVIAIYDLRLQLISRTSCYI